MKNQTRWTDSCSKNRLTRIDTGAVPRCGNRFKLFVLMLAWTLCGSITLRFVFYRRVVIASAQSHTSSSFGCHIHGFFVLSCFVHMSALISQQSQAKICVISILPQLDDNGRYIDNILQVNTFLHQNSSTCNYFFHNCFKSFNDKLDLFADDGIYLNKEGKRKLHQQFSIALANCLKSSK